MTDNQPTIQSKIIETLTHLVRFPSVSSDLITNKALIDWVEQQLSTLPLHIMRHEHNGVASLTATTSRVKDTKHPKLWLAAHTDVVPGDAKLFEPQISQNIMTARGSYDMKSALAVFLVLLQEIGPGLDHYDLGLMVTSDEEVSGTNGVGWLTSHGFRGQAVLLPDSLKTWQLEIGSKGAAFWRFTAHGQDAHGSRIWEGTNAVDKLLEFIEELRKNTTTEPCGDPNHLHHTLNIGRLHGGMIVNQVPQIAEAHVDIRITPEATLAHVDQWVKDAQTVVPGIEAEKLPMQAHPSKLPAVGPVKVFTRIAEQVTGLKIPHVFAHGGTDARWFADLDIPVITVNSTGGDPHTDNEWVDLDDLSRFYEVTRKFLDEWSKTAPK